jgi:DNA-binding NtrC family response regulator
MSEALNKLAGAGDGRLVRGSGATTVEDSGRSLGAEPRYGLVLLFGRLSGERRMFELEKSALRIGREVDGVRDVRLHDSRASRRHAEILWSEVRRRYWIRDLGSRNGVHVNGARVAREVLKPGDVIRTGETVFRFGVAPPETPDLLAIDEPFVGVSRSLASTLERAGRVASSDAPVLVLGPTGTGKEMLVDTIHRASGRRGALVAVNCAALPAHLVESELFGHEKGAFSGADSARAGLFRAAQGGTLFLDEVGELPADAQAKLLRALEAKAVRPVGAAGETPIQVRVVAATNRDLGAEVREGRFRADLFARLAETVVQLDALRDRLEDIDPLWRHFVAKLGQGAAIELSGAAFEAMALHSWPLNVRELRQVVRSAFLTLPGGGVLDAADLPLTMRPTRPEASAVEQEPTSALASFVCGEVPTSRQLRQLVEEFCGNVKEMAAFLGKDRKQVYRWLQRDQIDPDAYR